MGTSTLIAYYSMSGHTRDLANEIRDAVDADIEEIREPHARHGLPGVFRALLDSTLRRTPPILPADHDPGRYDIVLVGGPVWAGRMASPVRSYAKRYASQARQVAFFCTEGGRGADAAFADLERLCLHSPKATLVVDDAHRTPPSHRAELGHFTAQMSRGSPGAGTG
jgi:flavodoxin